VYRDNTILTIDPQGKLIDVRREAGSDDRAIGVAGDEPKGPEVMRSTDGFKGFKLDENNRIVGVSDLYDRYDGDWDWNVVGPFMINGKPYAVAHKKERSGIIDQAGNALRGFDFVHKELVRNVHAAGPLHWFYVVDEAGRQGFISEKGKTKLMGELMSYPFVSTDVMDYHIQDNDRITNPGTRLWGVLDQANMAWVIKPQPVNIERIDFLPWNVCGTNFNWNVKRDEKAEVYFLFKSGDDAWYVDRRGKAYKPK